MRGFSNWPLRWKMLALIVVVSVLPLAITAGMEFRESSTLIANFTESLLHANAEDVAGDVDEFNTTIRRSADRFSRLPEVTRFAAASPDRRSAFAADVSQVMHDLLVTDGRLRGIAVLDLEGAVIAGTEEIRPGRSLGFRRYFREASQGSASTPDINAALRDDASGPFLAYANPVRAGDRVVAVAVVFARASAVWDIVGQARARAGAGSFAMVLDQHGVVLAHGADPARVFHPAGALPAAELEGMAGEHRFGVQTHALLDQPLAVDGVFRRARGESLPEVFEARPLGDRAWHVVVSRRLATAPWTLFYLVPRSTLQAPVERLIARTAAANFVVVLLALVLGVWLARQILGPVRSLSAAAERLQHGDLGARVPNHGADELGRLGAAFNAMAESLAASRGELEERVRRRTEALAAAKEDAERQNAQLAQRTAELTERQAREVAFARALGELSQPGSQRERVTAALGAAEEYARTLGIACYRLDRELLVPVAARAAEPQGFRVAGRVEDALRSRIPVQVESLPEDAELRFDAGRPRSILLVPLHVGDRDVGMLVAGFVREPGPQHVAFMVDLALPLALAIVRHELHEQTERFALQLAQRNEVLRQQSDELAAKQRELTQKNDEIQRANQLKTEFLANMSHELRTPLNAVIGFSELLLEEEHRLAPEQMEFVRDILASGRHLLSLINGVLDLAKIEAGRVALEVKPLDPGPQIATACAVVSALAQKKSLRIDQVVRTDRTVLADGGKLQQILLNLLSNAIKFSDAGARVETGVEDQAGQLRFWVKDEGPGIAESLQPELFKPFVQGESPLVKKHEGTGLGLAITRRLVEYQGGDVGVDSAPAKGSTFWFTLPAHEQRAAAATQSAQASPPPPAPATHMRPLVLVVEDDAANARLLRFHLEGKGYAVAHARREQEALDVARRLKPQVVLLDLLLPDGGDGLQILRELKRDPESATIPVVVVSVVQETRRARELGAVECFVKPVDGAKVVEAVQRLSPVSPPAARSRATILVVDDHDLNRELARTLLERRGCRVLLARNGQEGARVAKVELPDLVLMDLAMPVKDGITAARELKADPHTSHIPLVAFTALAMRGDEDRARSAGFDGYLVKPLETRALDATLEQFLRSPESTRTSA